MPLRQVCFGSKADITHVRKRSPRNSDADLQMKGIVAPTYPINTFDMPTTTTVGLGACGPMGGRS